MSSTLLCPAILSRAKYCVHDCFSSTLVQLSLIHMMRSYMLGVALYYPLANEVARGYSNASFRPSVRPSVTILVNTLGSTSFNEFWPNLVHILSLRESGTLLIFKVKGQGHRVKFLQHNILVNTLESTSFNGFWPNLVHT